MKNTRNKTSELYLRKGRRKSKPDSTKYHKFNFVPSPELS